MSSILPSKPDLTGIKASILSQSEALKRFAHTVDDSFLQCLNLLMRVEGRLIISGIGKSALIGRKLAATFNSTGTSSFFMHAADALHGDLGMIAAGDLVLLLSKSGETAELKALVPLIKLRGNQIIALACNLKSYLAQHADHCIHLPLNEEADPHDLVPTTSATLQLVAGQSLAVALMQARNFTPQDFARSHPGGSLGKRLYLTISDLVDKERIPSVPLQATLRDIIVEISGKRQGAAVVTNDEGNVLGIITDGDLRRMLQRGANLPDQMAEHVMTHHPKCIPARAMATEALLLMRRHAISQVVVIDDNDRYQGLIHLQDLLKEGIV